MEKQRKIKVLSVVALVVAVLGLTIAFAALSQTLTINGTANVDAASWDIHFEDLETTTSGAGSFSGEPILNSTSVTDINIILTKPNDEAGIYVNVVNDGTINAKIDSVEVSPLCEIGSPVESCDWDNDGEVTEEDVQKVNDNVSVLVMYEDQTYLKKNDMLNVGESKKIVIGIGYYKLVEGDTVQVEESTELPARDLQFNDLSVTINYVQA